MTKKEEFGKSFKKIYDDIDPKKSILKISIHVLLNNWCSALLWMLVLVLTSIFAKRLENEGLSVTSSEMVTSLGLSQIVNLIIYAWFIGLAVAASSHYVRIVKKRNKETNDNLFGSIMFIWFIFSIVLSLFISLAGKYIVYLQNNGLTDNYKRIVENIMYFFAATGPFLGLTFLLYSYLSAEGHAWVSTVSGISTVILFVSLAEIFFSTHVFKNVIHPELQLTYAIGLAFLLTYIMNSLVLYGILIFLRKTGRSNVYLNLLLMRYATLKTMVNLFNFTISIFVRSFVVALGTILVNIILNIIPILPSWYKVVSTGGSSNPATALPNNSIYWQFITSAMAPILTFLLRGMYAIGGTPSRLLGGYHLSQTNYKKAYETYKWALIYVVIYLLFCTGILMAIPSPILSMFGITNNAIYSFIAPNGEVVQINAKYLNTQATRIMRISFCSVVFFAPQSVLASYCFARKKYILSMFVFSFDKVIFELPIFYLFAYFSGVNKLDIYWFAFISYIVSDILSGILLFLILAYYMRKILDKHKRKTTLFMHDSLMAN